jgi:asparagine synthase (glutamine-hydrolysing)
MGHSLADSYFSRTSSPAAYFNRHFPVFTPEFSNASSQASPPRVMRDVLRPVANATLLNQMLYVDSKTWLPDDLLLKADKMTMANSQELRVPLLDHVLLEFAASLPDTFKVRGHETKLALKAAFAKALPAEILTRKKAGFPVPFSGWMRHALAGRIRELLLSDLAVGRRIFEPAAVDRLLVNHVRTGANSKEVFAMLVVELWHRRFVDLSTAADRPVAHPREIRRLPAGGALVGRSA